MYITAVCSYSIHPLPSSLFLFRCTSPLKQSPLVFISNICIFKVSYIPHIKEKYVIFICIEMFYFDLLGVPAPV